MATEKKTELKNNFLK